MLNLLGEKEFRSRKIYLFLLILTVTSAFGLQLWRTLYTNFAVDVVGIDGFQNGAIQSLREIPGFLAFLVVYLLLVFKEHKLAALSIIILGFGVAVTGLYPNFNGLIASTVLLSIGFHYYETINQSLTLQHFDTKTAPMVFARMRSLTAVSNLIVGLTIFLLVGLLSYEILLLIGGAIVVIVGCYCYFMNPTEKEMPAQKKSIVLKKKYWLFYVLTFFAGARRQVFVAFAIFLLVSNFNYSIQMITVLFIVNNIINFFVSPLIGKAILRFGERKVLSLEYISLIFIFLAYAFTTSAVIVGVIYVLDHIFFGFSIGIRTYFQKICATEDIAPSMAIGFTINHIAAVVIPVLGGWLWLVDYRIPFIIAAVLSFISLIFTQFIQTDYKAP